MLIFSNVFFFSEYRRIKENFNKFFDLDSWVNIAADENDMILLDHIASIEDEEYKRELLNEIKTKGGSGYQIENYRVLKYINGNTLLIKITENRQGKFLIQDMFF